MKNENQHKQIAAIQNVTVKANQLFIDQALERVTADKTTEKVANILVRFCVAVASADIALNNESSIVSRNAYAVQKVTSTLRAMHMKLSAELDRYSAAFIFNANKRKDKALSNEEQNSVAREVESEKRRATDRTLTCAASTITTQRSSSCYALEACNIVKYEKSEKRIILNTDSDHVKRFTEQLKK